MDLNAQIAPRLFGWTLGRCRETCPYAQEGFHTADGAHAWRLPAYSTDPAATALVWQWVEQQRGLQDWTITFDYWAGKVSCRLSRYNGVDTLAHEDGASWPEALCRAALALAAGEGGG